jgi:polysaccharide biosynthesis protein PslG
MNDVVGRKSATIWSSLLFVVAIGVLQFAYIGSSAIAITNEVPGSYFGMTIIKTKLVAETKFGSRRTLNTFGLAWTDLNPTPGKYNWSNLDWVMQQAQSQGYDLLYTFFRTPNWASSEPTAPTPGYGPGECAPPSNIQYWDDFVRAIVTHAAGRIKYWEIWNEPQEMPPRGFYCGDISTMVKLQQHAYDIIKSIDRAAIVLTPSTAGGLGPQWMAKFLKAGGGQYADVMTFHGYSDQKGESVIPVISKFKRVFAAYGQGSKPVWDTEAGWLSTSDPNLQSAFLAKYYLLHWSSGVSRFYWYAYDEPQWGTLWDGTNGLRKTGVAYEEIRKWMTGATMDGPCAVRAAVWTCNFSRPNGHKAIAVWSSVPDSSFAVDSKYKQYRDLTGNITKISGHGVPISNMPILIETEFFIQD